MPEPSEDFLHRMYERSPVGFYRSTFDGRFVFANPALVKMLGYDRQEEVLQLRLAEDVYADAADRRRLIEEYRASGVLDGLKVRWRARDGRPLVVQVYGYLRPEDDCIDVTVIDCDRASHRARSHRAATPGAGAQRHHVAPAVAPAARADVDGGSRLCGSPRPTAPPSRRWGRRVEDELGKTLYEFYGTDRSSYLPIRRHIEALEGRWGGFHQEVAGKQFEVTLAPHRTESRPHRPG